MLKAPEPPCNRLWHEFDRVPLVPLQVLPPVLILIELLRRGLTPTGLIKLVRGAVVIIRDILVLVVDLHPVIIASGLGRFDLEEADCALELLDPVDCLKLGECSLRRYQ